VILRNEQNLLTTAASLKLDTHSFSSGRCNSVNGLGHSKNVSWWWWWWWWEELKGHP